MPKGFLAILRRYPSLNQSLSKWQIACQEKSGFRLQFSEVFGIINSMKLIHNPIIKPQNLARESITARDAAPVSSVIDPLVKFCLSRSGYEL
jgi:hypothetical protein